MTLVFHTPLSAAEQTAAGLLHPAPLAMADQVRFSELDILNHVNNVAYLNWFERLRIRYTQDWGLSDYNPARRNQRVVIRSGTVHYREEMRMDERYIVTCRCSAFRRTSFSLAQEIWSDRRIKATFECVLVLLHPDAPDRMPLSAELRDRFITVDKAQPEVP